MRTRIIFFLTFFCVASLLVAGCAEVPRPLNFDYSAQRQFQSARHWEVIAKELLSDLLSEQDRNPKFVDLIKTKSGESQQRVFVQNSDRVPFEEAFRRYLTTELIMAGFLLSDTADDAAIRIHWDIQLVNRNRNRLQPIGMPEAVASEVVAFLTGIRWTTSDIGAPHTEVIHTTRVTVGGESLAHTIRSYSKTYYINDGDWENYNYQLAASSSVHPRSIRAKDEAWKTKLKQQGLLAQ
jgi:hypothetical protein